MGFAQSTLHRQGNQGTADADRIKYIKSGSMKAEGCFGCASGCKPVWKTPGGTKPAVAQMCSALWYRSYDVAKHGTHTVVFANVSGLTDSLGLDTREIGSMIKWLQGCYKDGTLTPEKTGINFTDLGEYDWAVKFLTMWATREGFGDVMAEGTLRASEKLGKIGQAYLINDTRGFAASYTPEMHTVSALEGAMDSSQRLEHYHPYAKEGIEKNIMHSGGAGWITTNEYSNRLKEIFGRGDIINHVDDAFYAQDKAWLSRWFEDYKTAVSGGMELCDWMYPRFWTWYSDKPNRAGYSPEAEPKLYSLVTGIEMDLNAAKKAGERIRNLERAIMVREGRRRDQDTLDPSRFTKGVKDFKDEPNADGVFVTQTRILDKPKFEKLKDFYYTERGWDLRTGIPTRAKLEELDLKDVADKLAV